METKKFIPADFGDDNSLSCWINEFMGYNNIDFSDDNTCHIIGDPLGNKTLVECSYLRSGDNEVRLRFLELEGGNQGKPDKMLLLANFIAYINQFYSRLVIIPKEQRDGCIDCAFYFESH